MDGVTIGTCSWNYDSWVGLVYSQPRATAAEYLPEYSVSYRTVEIDSWFYRMPQPRDVQDCLAAVDPGFRFTCKAPQDLTLTFTRGAKPVPNPAFLSPELFSAFMDRIEPMRDRIDAVILEFEYLNRQKMPSQAAFLERLQAFIDAVPRDIPIALEPRNGPWLDGAWFEFLRANGLSHVFSEKLYLPPITDLYGRFGHLLAGPAVVRLLGGDRAAIEEKTGSRWDAIVEPNPRLEGIAAMVASMAGRGNRVTVNVNNHFEGSAPLTIGRLIALLDAHPTNRR